MEERKKEKKEKEYMKEGRGEDPSITTYHPCIPTLLHGIPIPALLYSSSSHPPISEEMEGMDGAQGGGGDGGEGGAEERG